MERKNVILPLPTAALDEPAFTNLFGISKLPTFSSS